MACVGDSHMSMRQREGCSVINHFSIFFELFLILLCCDVFGLFQLCAHSRHSKLMLDSLSEWSANYGLLNIL